jgi:hypothetical protein
MGCSSVSYLEAALSNPPVTPIRDLPKQERGATVYVTGRVSNPAPFLDSGAYQLQDATGTVWVLTPERLPTQGTEVTIKGQVEYQSIPIGMQELGELYIREIEKSALSSQPQNQPQSPSASPPPTPTQPSTEDLFLPHKRLEK